MRRERERREAVINQRLRWLWPALAPSQDGRRATIDSRSLAPSLAPRLPLPLLQDPSIPRSLSCD